MNKSDSGAAEDCFLLAIEVDDDNIDARIELAGIYEAAREDEEALILVTEAIALSGRTRGPDRSAREGEGQRKKNSADAADPTDSAGEGATTTRRGRKPRMGVVTRRYRPKRLVGPDQRRREERERADELSRRFTEVRNLKRDIRGGARDKAASWMAAARDLVDDFRSFRQFYTWDKYVKFLGAANEMVFNAPYELQPGTSELHKLAERLQRSLSPTIRRRTLFALSGNREADSSQMSLPSRETTRSTCPAMTGTAAFHSANGSSSSLTMPSA